MGSREGRRAPRAGFKGSRALAAAAEPETEARAMAGEEERRRWGRSRWHIPRAGREKEHAARGRRAGEVKGGAGVGGDGRAGVRRVGFC